MFSISLTYFLRILLVLSYLGYWRYGVGMWGIGKVSGAVVEVFLVFCVAVFPCFQKKIDWTFAMAPTLTTRD